MASENIELVRQIYTNWKRGDFGSADWADRGIEVVVPDGPQPGTFRGLAGFAEAWRTWTDMWSDFQAEPTEIRELDGNRVLVLIRRSGRGKASGLELQELRTDGAAVFHVHGGRVTRIVNYFDRERALADLSLESSLERFIASHRAAIEAFNRGDIDAALANFPEDAEWHAFSDDLHSSVLRGPEAVKQFFEDFRGVFDEWRSEPLGYEEIRGGTVLVHHVIRGTSRAAGVPVEVDTWELWEFDTANLQPIRVRQFPSRAGGLEAARIDA